MLNYEQDEVKRERLESHWAGKAASLESFESKLKMLSGAAFSAGQDERAKVLREVSIMAGQEALDHRKKQKEFQPQFSGGL